MSKFDDVMGKFNNISVVKQANVYFDGKVVSRTVLFPDGSKKTLGIMQPGEYLFNTDAKEEMEIMSGELDVRIGDSQDWQPVKGGQTFEVPARSQFTVRVKTLTDYCCSFIK